jgi:hypothetical protein
MELLVILLGLGAIYSALVLCVMAGIDHLEQAKEETDSDWDNESWETQRG